MSSIQLTWHTDLEDDIQKLEGNAELAPADKQRLEDLKKELENINKKKEDYVAEHPEHRKLVYRARKSQRNEDGPEGAPKPQARNLFNKNGLPRHPERSIYYDPVLNPFGVPPPGMPYMERGEFSEYRAFIYAYSFVILSVEGRRDSQRRGRRRQRWVLIAIFVTRLLSACHTTDVDDDDIAMPSEPPPGPSANAEADSDDDIPLPDGPPPPKGPPPRKLTFIHPTPVFEFTYFPM